MGLSFFLGVYLDFFDWKILDVLTGKGEPLTRAPHIEAVYSFLKTQYSLAINKVRGVRNVASYALYSLLCLVLNREAAENINRPDKAVSPTYFNT